MQVKKIFDFLGALFMLFMLFPLMLIIALAIVIDSGFPVFFVQKRIGQYGKTFRLIKFRTMKVTKSNTSIAAEEINRITGVGKILRKIKIDELPELINILKGEMSFVGPRPDVPGYADRLEGDDRVIIELKPGLTGAASLKYIDEETILANKENPKEYNDKIIWPDKVRLNKLYYYNRSFRLDIKLLIFTFLRKQITENDIK